MKNLLKSVLFIAGGAVVLSAADLPTVNVFGEQSEKKKASLSDFESEDFTLEDVPDWVSDLSNLPEADRRKYMNNFSAAKWAFSKGALDMCEQCLDECDAVYSKNPNVWNLRASVQISRKQFDAAEIWLKKVRAVAPDDLVANLNYSLMFLGQGKYERCVEECDVLLSDLEYKDNMEGLLHTLTFRKLVCFVLMGRVEEARDLVKDVTPMTFTPLYYYSQSVFALVENDRKRALKEMTSANSIYRTDAYLPTYKQALEYSNFMEKITNQYTK